MAGKERIDELIEALRAEGELISEGAFTLDPDHVENVVLPGSLGTAGGGSVVFLGDDANAMIADLADDGLLNR